MIQKRLYTCALALFASIAAVPAHASLLGEIWQNTNPNQNASVIPAGSPDAEFNTSAVNYDSRGANGDATNYTASSFLNNPSFFNTSKVFNPNGTLDNSFILLSGLSYLNKGSNTISTTHDDGVVISFDGIGTVINAPTRVVPTSQSATFNAPTAGFYNLSIQYQEIAGAPAVLTAQINGANPVGTPEPASMGLLGGGLMGLAIWGRRRLTRKQ